jgi:uncharacterized protein (UPF0333 family)
LFTILLEYGGGTYISQVRANSTSKAVVKWATSLDVAALTRRRKDDLLRRITEDEPVKITGADGIWCVSADIGNKLALVTIVQTAVEKQVPRLRREARLRSG